MLPIRPGGIVTPRVVPAFVLAAPQSAQDLVGEVVGGDRVGLRTGARGKGGQTKRLPLNDAGAPEDLEQG